MAQESRQVSDPRISLPLRARISTLEPEIDRRTGKRFFRTSEEVCANVSRRGVFISMQETIPKDQRVLVELELPGDHEVEIVGRVAWVRDAPTTEAPAGKALRAGIGVQFLAGHGHSLRRLDRFLTRAIRRARGTDAARPELASTRQS